jgi:hypothetical protein
MRIRPNFVGLIPDPGGLLPQKLFDFVCPQGGATSPLPLATNFWRNSFFAGLLLLAKVAIVRRTFSFKEQLAVKQFFLYMTLLCRYYLQLINLLTISSFKSGAKPTIASYNAPSCLVRFEDNTYLCSFYEKRTSLLQLWRCSCKFKSRCIGSCTYMYIHISCFH